VKPYWHPLSTVLIAEPRCWATDALLRLLLRSTGQARVLYAGDRMWPALRHGQPVVVRAVRTAPAPGAVVLALPDGLPDLLRVVAVDGSRIALAADADPGTVVELPVDAVLAVAVGGERRGPRAPRLLRMALDLDEAWCGTQDAAASDDPATTVRAKYDDQAPHYARGGLEVKPALLERVREHVSPGGRVLVVGSGAGTECIALARRGYRVTGIDFAPRMIDMARAAAADADVDVTLVRADVRSWRPEPSSLDLVLFTYDVYSFLPGSESRVRVLRGLRSALAAGGVVLLSARRVADPWSRLVLTIEWLAALRRGRDGEWGDSHTRWIGGDGRIGRSFVRVFTERELAREAALAGFRAEAWSQGHAVLRPAGSQLRV
jgi:SAM-dependent methyltransferase